MSFHSLNFAPGRPVTLSTLGTLISLALPRQLAPGAPPSYVGLLPRGHTLDMLEVMVTRAASVAAKRHGKTAPPGAEWIEGDEKENLDIAAGEERVGELIFELTGFPFHGVLDLGMPKRFWQACRCVQRAARVLDAACAMSDARSVLITGFWARHKGCSMCVVLGAWEMMKRGCVRMQHVRSAVAKRTGLRDRVCACRILVLLSAFNTSTLGRVAWQELPTIRSTTYSLCTTLGVQ